MRRLAAGLDHVRGRKQSDDGLARADVAMQQAKHAMRLRQIGDDVGDRALLRWRQRIGQGGNNARAQNTLGGAAAARPRAHVRAKERERELAGQQFVIGEPRPGGAFRLEVVGRRRTMNAAQGVGKARKAVAGEPCRVLPFRQFFGHAFERKLDGPAQLVGMKPFGERIDRIDERQPRQIGGIDHAVGMHHLQVAVIEGGGARHVALLADREQLLQIVRARVEIGDDEIVGFVARVDEVRRARAVRRRRPVTIDGDGDRHHRVGLDIAKLWLVAPVDEAARQVKE